MSLPFPTRRWLLPGVVAAIGICHLAEAEDTAPPVRELAGFTYAGNQKMVFQVQEYLRANAKDAAKRQALAEAVRKQAGDLKSEDSLQLACLILAEVGAEQDVPFLTAQLKKPAVFPAAKLALQNIATPPAVAALLDFAPGATPEQMESLLLSYGLLNVPATVPYTVAMTRHETNRIRRAAFQALSQNDAPEAVAALSQATPKTEDGSATAMVALARQIVGTRKDEARQLCERVAKDGALPIEARAAAIRVMARNDLPGTGELLGQFENTTDGQMRPLLLENFRRLTPDTQAKLVKEVRDAIGKPEAVAQLSAIGEAYPPAELLPLAISAHTKLREVALRLLGQNGTEAEFQKALAAYVAGKPDDARTERWRAVLLALPAASDAWTVEALQKSSDPATQLALIRIAQARRIRVAGAELMAALKSPDANVRAAAADALATVGAPALALQLGDLFLTSTDTKVRGRLALALTTSLRDSPMRTEVIRHLSGQLGTVQEAALREQLIAILANSGEAEAQASLWKLYDTADPATQKSIVRGMAQWKKTTALPRLAEIATISPDEAVKILAARSYLEVVAKSEDLDAAGKIKSLSAAQKFTPRVEERRLIIAQAAAIAGPEAVALIETYQGDDALKEEVQTALASQKKIPSGSAGEFE